MAIERRLIPLSYSPSNADAAFVLAALAQIPPRQRSATIWRWLAAYLRGQTHDLALATDEAADAEAALDELLDAL